MLSQPDQDTVGALNWIARHEAGDTFLKYLKKNHRLLHEMVEKTDEDLPVVRGASRIIGELIASLEKFSGPTNPLRVSDRIDGTGD